jgi:predicted dehydrogenase
MAYRAGVFGTTIERAWSLKPKFDAIGTIETVAVADHDDRCLATAKEVFGLDDEHLYKDYESMLDNEQIDIAFIFGEPTLHLEAVKLCAPRGIHCFVEKPFSLTLADAEEMIAICKEHNVRLMANVVYGYDAHLLGLHREIAEEKKLGDLLFMRWKGGNPGPKGKCTPPFYEALRDKDRGGGVIMDYVPYGGVLFSYYVGGVPNTVYAKSANFDEAYEGVEDYAIVTLMYEQKGVIGTIECSWNEEVPGGQWFNVTGTKGTLFHNQASNVGNIYGGMDYYYKLKGETSEKIETPVFDSSNPDAITHFIDCIENNKEIQGMVHPDRARDAAEIIDAVRMSIKTGREVRLPLNG